MAKFMEERTDLAHGQQSRCAVVAWRSGKICDHASNGQLRLAVQDLSGDH